LVTAGSSPGGGGLGVDPGAHPLLPCRLQGLARPDVDDRPAVALQQEGGPAGLLLLLLEPLPLQPEVGMAEVADDHDGQPVLQPGTASGGPPGGRGGSALPACWLACWPASPLPIREARATPTPRPWEVKRWTSEAADETQASKESAPSERRACERRRSSSRTIARGSEGRSSWRTMSRPCRAVVRQWIFFTSSPGWYSRMVKNSSPTGVGARG